MHNFNTPINRPPGLAAAALAWEVFDEYDKAPDKAMFLAVCRAYNAGEMQITEPEQKAA